MVALLPYIGLIIDGCERWSQKVRPLKEFIKSFSDEEKQFYAELRNSIKLWETPFLNLHILLKGKYDESERYFANCCKPIAKDLKLYDIYGAYLINNHTSDGSAL